jgi:cytochrome P450 family 135
MRRGRRGLPPGPPLPEMVQSLMLWTSIDRFLEGCVRRYGPVFTAKIAPMGTLVYVTDPAEIKRIFTGDTSVFHAGEANATVLERIMGRHSVLIVDDDEHLRQRRRMLPPFHGESVRRYGEVIEEVTRAEMARWPRGTAFALHPRMQAIALEVILRAVIGVEDPVRLAELRGLLPQLGELNIVLLLSWSWPRLNAFGPWRRYERLRHAIDEVLYDEIRRRRATADLERREDILSLLIRGSDGEEPMTDEELRDQLITLLLAGHETTATGLAWAVERLLRHPQALARLEQEIAAGEDAYLDAVVKETLRVRPVIFDVARKLKAPAEVAGYTLPAGVTVMPAVGIVQRSRQRWSEPREFRPERFLEGQPEPYTWIPFGGGTRRCLGAAFATVEMKTVLRAVLSELELRADRPQPERARMRHITLVPSRGARAIASERPKPLPAGESTAAAVA